MRRVVEATITNNTEIEKKYRYSKVPNGKYTKWGCGKYIQKVYQN